MLPTGWLTAVPSKVLLAAKAGGIKGSSCNGKNKGRQEFFCQPGHISPLPPSSCQSCPSTRGRGGPAGRASCPGFQPGACAPSHPPSRRLFQHQLHLRWMWMEWMDLWLRQAGRKLENGKGDCQKEQAWHAKSKLCGSKGNSPLPFEQDSHPIMRHVRLDRR